MPQPAVLPQIHDPHCDRESYEPGTATCASSYQVLAVVVPLDPHWQDLAGRLLRRNDEMHEPHHTDCFHNSVTDSQLLCCGRRVHDFILESGQILVPADQAA